MFEFLWLLPSIISIIAIALMFRLAILFLKKEVPFYPQKEKEQEEILPYKRRESLLTPAERVFFKVLLETISDSYHVFPKVRMADILFVPRMENKRYYHFFNKIQSKHVDFLLCDKEAMEPILAIELDDSSHKNPRRRSRDSLVNAIFESAGLPILHIPTARLYEKEAISAEIQNALSTEESPESV